MTVLASTDLEGLPSTMGMSYLPGQRKEGRGTGKGYTHAGVRGHVTVCARRAPSSAGSGRRSARADCKRSAARCASAPSEGRQVCVRNTHLHCNQFFLQWNRESLKQPPCGCCPDSVAACIRRQWHVAQAKLRMKSIIAVVLCDI